MPRFFHVIFHVIFFCIICWFFGLCSAKIYGSQCFSFFPSRFLSPDFQVSDHVSWVSWCGSWCAANEDTAWEQTPKKLTGIRDAHVDDLPCHCLTKMQGFWYKYHYIDTDFECGLWYYKPKGWSKPWTTLDIFNSYGEIFGAIWNLWNFTAAFWKLAQSKMLIFVGKGTAGDASKLFNLILLFRAFSH